MIDVAKNFKPKEWIIKLLEVMGMYKLNTLQLHLTDNEGWRFEMSEPRLMVNCLHPEAKESVHVVTLVYFI